MSERLGRGEAMSSRTVDSDADARRRRGVGARGRGCARGPRIARRIWGPVTKDVSESIGAPAAVASVLLQPRCIPFELLQEVSTVGARHISVETAMKYLS